MLSFIKRHHVILVSAILLLFSLYLMENPRKGTGGEVIVKKALSAAGTPVRSLFSKMSSSVKSTLEEYAFVIGVKKENDELKSALAALVEENNSLKEELGQNSRLKGLLDFREKAGVKTVAVRILSLSGLGLSGDWTRVAAVDRGEADGVKADMPVTTAQGLVGRVIEAGTSSSTVLLVTDPRSNIDVIVQRTRVRGIANGNGNGLTLKYVRALDSVAAGDKIIADGISGIFPKGILVGEITHVERGKDNFFKHIEIRPAADMANLEEVLVITGNPASFTLGLKPIEEAPSGAKSVQGLSRGPGGLMPLARASRPPQGNKR